MILVWFKFLILCVGVGCGFGHGLHRVAFSRVLLVVLVDLG